MTENTLRRHHAAVVLQDEIMNETMNKRGRPKKENARTNGYRIRMTDEESANLDELQKIYNLPKAQIIRDALSEYYDKTIKKKRKK